MSTTTPLTDNINALTAYSNQKTGASDTTLSDAVVRLVAGYGSGSSSGAYSGTYTPSENTLAPSFNIGSSNFSHFVIYPTTDTRGTVSIKHFLFTYTGFGEKDVITVSTQNTGSSQTFGFYQYKWFSKSGSTVECTDNGTSGAGHVGYWLAGITYQWYAW